MNTIFQMLKLFSFSSQETDVSGEKNVKINVSYKSELTRVRLIEEIRQVKNPQVIFWYIGIYGLRQQGVYYYRKDLTKILQTSNADCQLYDLTAWKAFNPCGTENDSQSFNENADLISKFAIPRIRCLKSCDFFKWLQVTGSGQKAEYLKKILERPFIYKASQDCKEMKRTVGEIFKRQCPVLEEIYELDASKSYSALQYVEGIYLIQQLVQRALIEQSESEAIDLIFALPNDENHFYQNEENSFETDVKMILQEEMKEILKGKTVNVYFYAFQYGDGKRNRPYNAPSPNIDIKSVSDVVKLPQFSGGKK